MTKQPSSAGAQNKQTKTKLITFTKVKGDDMETFEMNPSNGTYIKKKKNSKHFPRSYYLLGTYHLLDPLTITFLDSFSKMDGGSARLQ